jgi:asparagine synthase (glutamine-hydrolysing)
MCGIAGFIGKGTEADLNEMIATLKQRGPDYQGTYLHDAVGLAHARLSIIDLSSSANQPFLNHDKSIGIVFNGEIYNFQELKNELQKLNKYTFVTTSDTEVLLYAYEEYEEKLFDKINGMFAFAIYDFRKNQLLLARDRMGKKPLYYGTFSGTFVFASEIKALLRHPAVSRELNIDALNEYLTFEYVPTPHSIFKNIYKLEPAVYLLWENSTVVKKQPYWKVPFDTAPISFDDAQKQLYSLLNDAVSVRLVSDVPLGVFLSGGLDSSTVAYFAQKNSTARIKTFSIGFEDKSYDESNYAASVARHLGTEHYVQTLTEKQSLDLIPELSTLIDEPFADPSIIPTYLLSKFTRSKVTVALGGDGSDELLAGYPTFISNYFIDSYAALPALFQKVIKRIASYLPVSDKNISFDFKVKQFIKGFELPKQYVHSLWLGSFSPAEKNCLLSRDALSEVNTLHGLEVIDRYLFEVSSATPFNQLLYTYYRTYLLEDILVKVDRASMFTSLEVRVPFLDYRIVEFLSRLPGNFKVRGFTGKYILKELMRSKIPDEIIDRPKKGFGIPLSYWLRNELKPLCNELLSEQSLARHSLFNYAYIKQLKDDHFAIRQNNRKLLWTLMIFQMWYQKWFC